MIQDDKTAAGFDSAATVTRLVDRIKAQGLGFVGRYYSRNPAKNLSAGEARALSVAGISIVTVWEAQGNLPTSFSRSHGFIDASDALRCAQEVDQPAGSVIYFAVDFDASPTDLTIAIIPYSQAVRTALAGHYRLGVYGSGLVCDTLKTQGIVECTWLGGAMGWRSSRTYTGYDILQGLPTDSHGFGFAVDPDTARGDYGGWMLSAAAQTG